jgi:hypothetical protein
MAMIPAIVVVVLMAGAAQLASAGFPNQYWPAPAPPTPTPSVLSTGFPTSGWEDAHATFYGDDSGLGHDFGTYMDRVAVTWRILVSVDMHSNDIHIFA